MPNLFARRLGVTLLFCALAAPAQALQLTDTLGITAMPQVTSERAMAPLELALGLEFSAEMADGLQQDEAVPDRVEAEALTLLGTSYRLGGTGERGIDCSALMQRAFEAAGVALPRTTREMLKSGEAVADSELRKGDLLFYRWKQRMLHVAMYVDDGYIVHASPAAGRVVITKLDNNWQRRLVAVRRLL